MTTNEQVSWDDYDTGKPAGFTPKPFPHKGLYVFQVPTTLNDSCFKTGKEGQLIAEIDPLVILGGEFAGCIMRFTRISNKRYANRNACSMGDFILACNSPFRPQADDQWKQAVLATAGQTLQIAVDWEAYDKLTQKTLASTETDFPMKTDADGVQYRQRYIEVDDASQPDGKRRVWANLKSKYFRSL